MMKTTTLFGSLIALLLLTACNAKRTDTDAEKPASEKPVINGVARHVVDDALSRMQDADADVEDALPVMDEAYTDGEDATWTFFEEGGELEALYSADSDSHPKTCHLSKRGPAAYDVYEGERAVSFCVLRVKDGGEVIEMTEGSKTTLFKTTERFIRDVKASGDDREFSEKDYLE